MLNLVLFGGPGSGKGTQSDKLIDRYGLYHISTGELLRDHIARNTELGRLADSYISLGHLIPDDLMVDILAHELDSHSDISGVILDGFPRTVPQAEALDKMLAERGHNLDAVIGLEVPDEELESRLLNRGKDSGRADDSSIETIRERINVFHEQTSPLREHYIKKGKYHAINGIGSVESIFNDIVGHLDPIAK